MPIQVQATRAGGAVLGVLALSMGLLVGGSPGGSSANASTTASALDGARGSVDRARITERIHVPRLNWHPCGNRWPGVQCAKAVVPLDYDKPEGRTTKIALSRVRGDRSRPLKGTVFVNPGGPGGSGVSMVANGFGKALRRSLHGRFDVVGFDPRGVGRSDPLHCFASRQELAEFFDGQPIFPYERDQYQPFYSRYAALGDKCLDGSDPVARHMSTADVVRDLNLLRRAVGDRRLTFLGFSYGSYIGNTYANLFPNKIRALVIDGVLDPKLWSSGGQIRSDRVATREEFAEFLRLCDEARRECALWAPGGSRHRWNALADAVEKEPIDLDGSVYTYDLLINDATSAMYSPEFWGDYADYFAALADAALRSTHVRAAAAKRASLLERVAPAEPHYSNGFEAYYGNQCADTQYPKVYWKWRAIDRYAASASRFGPYWWWYNNGCAQWPVAADRYTGPWSTRTSRPVLVVGNYFDGVTDYAGAQASAENLRGSRLLSYAGWGHTAYGRSDCAARYINAYLLRRSLPAKGTVCPANRNPFRFSPQRSDALSQIGLPPAGPLR